MHVKRTLAQMVFVLPLGLLGGLHMVQAAIVSGSTPGQLSVSSSGAATYRIPIPVPPGLAGMQPKLAVFYSSQAGNGVMGMGWGLSGLSSITRCPATMASDGARGSIKFDMNDRFCLNGSRLTLIGGVQGAAGSEYRSEQETFSKILAYGSAGNGPAYFIEKTKVGLTLEYGNTADSRIEAVAGGATPAWSPDTVRVWALNKITDIKGNYLTVSYNEDAANGVYSPARIDYAGNLAAGTPTHSSVRFSYDARANPIAKYQGGAISKLVSTMNEIAVYNGESTLVSTTKLSYGSAGTLQTPQLSSLQQCDGAGQCLSPLNLTYWPASNDFSSTPTPWAMSAPTPYSSAAAHKISVSEPFTLNGYNPVPGTKTVTSLVDLNGDGLPDLLTVLPYDGSKVVYFNTGSGFSSTPTPWAMPAQTPYTNFLAHKVVTVEPLPVSSYNASRPYWWPQNQPFPVNCQDTQPYWWPPSQPFPGSDCNAASTNKTITSLVDLNGDGLPDLFTVLPSDGSKVVYFNTGSGFSSTPTPWPMPGLPPYYAAHEVSTIEPVNVGTTGTALGKKTTTSLVDLNGDGLPDLFTTLPDGSKVVYFNTGVGFSSTATPWPAPATAANASFPTDDVFISEPFTLTGSNAVPAKKTITSLIDLNGDGLPDLLTVLPYDGSKVVYFNQSLPADLLAQISSDTGPTTKITYARLSNSGVYTKDSGVDAAVFPVVDVQAPANVVSTIDTSNGVTGYNSAFNTTAYSYGGLKFDRGTGRGMQGFRWIKSVEQATQLETYTEMRQDFPYTGLVIKSETRLAGAGNAGVLKRNTSTAACKIPQTGAACVIQQRCDLSDNSAACKAAADNRYFTFVASTLEENWDLNGAAFPSVTSAFFYGTEPASGRIYGDPNQITATTSDGSSKSTVNEYWPADTVNWVLGRLKKATVTSIKP